MAVARTTAIAKSSDASLVPFLAAATTKGTADVLQQMEPLLPLPAERDIMAKIQDVRQV